MTKGVKMNNKIKLILTIIISGFFVFLSGKMIYDRLMIYLYKDKVEIIETNKTNNIPHTQNNNNAKEQSINTDTKTVDNTRDNSNNINPQSNQQTTPQPKLYKICLKYNNKKAKKVKLNGSFYSWKERDMKKEKDGWTSELTLKDAGEYKYYFIVDGKKTLDPKAKKSKDGSFSLLEVK